MKRLLVAGLIAATSLSSGCSLIFVRRPPEHVGAEPVTCTSSRIAPAFDTAFALLLAAGGTTTLVTRDGVSGEGFMGGIAITGLFIASAISGYVRTSACAEAIEAQQERQRLEPDMSSEAIPSTSTTPTAPAASTRPPAVPAAAPPLNEQPVRLFEGPPSQSTPPPTPLPTQPETVPVTP